MGDVTRILSAIQQDQTCATEQLLPLVYDELRRLAAQKLASEKPGQTLQATALVHEAYLRLVDGEQAQQFENRRHFFGAAAEAMRRILIEQARRKATRKRGGDFQRLDLDEQLLIGHERSEQILALDEAIRELERHDEPSAELIKLRYFAGLTHQEAAEALGLSRRQADRVWTLARAWLYERLAEE